METSDFCVKSTTIISHNPSRLGICQTLKTDVFLNIQLIEFNFSA